jgi:hypothetical protein
MKAQPPGECVGTSLNCICEAQLSLSLYVAVV